LERIRVVAREGGPAPEEPSGGGSHEAPRSRLRRALLCPFCRDEVTRKSAVLCARRSCGALYHRECWDECATQYGGCAIYGCSSKTSREVTRTGYVLRLVRLLVAAAFFPRRVVRAIDAYEEPAPGVRGVVPRRGLSLILARTTESLRLLAPGESLSNAVVFVAVSCLLVTSLAFSHANHSTLESSEDVFLGHLALVGWTAGALFGLVLASVVGFHLLRVLGHVLESEVGALRRADEGATVLGRLRRGDGKK